MTGDTPPERSPWPKRLGWSAFFLTAGVLGAAGFAVVSLSSSPGGSGADPGAKVLVAVAVAVCAALIGFAVWAIAALLARLV